MRPIKLAWRGFLFCICLVLALFANAAQATVRFVTTTGGGTGTGSFANASSDLQGMINALGTSGDQIWVATGVYMPTVGTGRAKTFTLKKNVSVYGGFAGTETNDDTASRDSHRFSAGTSHPCSVRVA